MAVGSRSRKHLKCPGEGGSQVGPEYLLARQLNRQAAAHARPLFQSKANGARGAHCSSFREC